MYKLDRVFVREDMNNQAAHKAKIELMQCFQLQLDPIILHFKDIIIIFFRQDGIPEKQCVDNFVIAICELLKHSICKVFFDESNV